MSLLHMPLGKVCQQGKEISIIKVLKVVLFHIVTETVREKSIQYTVQPQSKNPVPFLKIGSQSLYTGISLQHR